MWETILTPGKSIDINLSAYNKKVPFRELLELMATQGWSTILDECYCKECSSKHLNNAATVYSNMDTAIENVWKVIRDIDGEEIRSEIVSFGTVGATGQCYTKSISFLFRKEWGESIELRIMEAAGKYFKRIIKIPAILENGYIIDGIAVILSNDIT